LYENKKTSDSTQTRTCAKSGLYKLNNKQEEKKQEEKK
jgi:hypothetical protein